MLVFAGRVSERKESAAIARVLRILESGFWSVWIKEKELRK